MLVLSRKKNESIRIADDIEVKVLEVRGDRVRLGINAPDDVCVMRHELLFDGDASADSPLPCSRSNLAVISQEDTVFQNDARCLSSAHDQPALPR